MIIWTFQCAVWKNENNKNATMASDWHPVFATWGFLLLAKQIQFALQFKAPDPLKQMYNSLISRNILKLGAYLEFKAYAELRKNVLWIIMC